MKISISESSDTKRYPLVRKNIPITSWRVRRVLKVAERKAVCLEVELYAQQGGEVAVGLHGLLIAALTHQQARLWWPVINEMSCRKVTLCAAVTMGDHSWWVELPSIEAAIEAINHTNVQICYGDFSLLFDADRVG